MTHSVAQHLRIDVRQYDATIRRLMPGYETMLDEAVAAVVAARPMRTLDLGAGTGALSERLLAATDDGIVELWDVDPAMLATARDRLARFGSRALPLARSFDDPFPPCGAIMASLALHHIHTLEAKAALYRRAASALAAGGVLAIADITIPAEAPRHAATYRRWADHMVASGIDERAAWNHFAEWAGEDRYFAIEQEIAALEAAGLEPAVRWSEGPATVLTGTRR